MDKKEFNSWKAETERSVKKWMVDGIHDGRNGQDLLAFKGGKDGDYFMVRQDGIVEMGIYEGAIPHIGEAMFKVLGKVQCKDFNDAVTRFFTAMGLNFFSEYLMIH